MFNVITVKMLGLNKSRLNLQEKTLRHIDRNVNIEYTLLPIKGPSSSKTSNGSIRCMLTLSLEGHTQLMFMYSFQSRAFLEESGGDGQIKKTNKL